MKKKRKIHLRRGIKRIKLVVEQTHFRVEPLPWWILINVTQITQVKG